MYLAGYIEKVGTGTEDIVKKCVDYGLKKPEYYQDEDFRVVIWRQTKDSIPNQNVVKADEEGVVDQILEEDNKQKSSQKSSQKIFDLVKENDNITINELSCALQISDRAVKKNIALLKAAGRLRRIGPDKGGYWEVVE